MDQIATLAKIRKKRLENAQTAVLVAHGVIVEYQEKIAKAKDELREYEEELPELIRQLYVDVIGHKVDVPFVQEKMKLELRLVQKKQDFMQRIAKLESELVAAKERLVAAQHELAIQERKNLAMQELQDDERKKARLAEDKLLAKAIDELSTCAYVARHG